MPIFPKLQLDVDNFLQTHWQRKHCVIPQGMNGFSLPGSADELAGLALEPDVDSQIIRGSGTSWHREKGPFSVEDLQQDSPWTLLVQGVDQYWDTAAALLNSVPFIPSWRCDDIMMSYASDGGSAGPHYDNYDVFIIQGEGERRWQLGQRCDSATPLLPCEGVRLIANFQVEHEYTLKQGDVLYIPPGTAHFGTSIGESTSLSIGFRAPRLNALLARWTDAVLEHTDASQLFRDAGRQSALLPGQIDDADLARAREQLLHLLRSLDAKEFGEVITDTTIEVDEDDHPGATNLADAQSCAVSRQPGSRLAWHEHESSITVFANGASRVFPGGLRTLVVHLSNPVASLEVDLQEDHTSVLIEWLFEQQVLVADEH